MLSGVPAAPRWPQCSQGALCPWGSPLPLRVTERHSRDGLELGGAPSNPSEGCNTPQVGTPPEAGVPLGGREPHICASFPVTSQKRTWRRLECWSLATSASFWRASSSASSCHHTSSILCIPWPSIPNPAAMYPRPCSRASCGRASCIPQMHILDPMAVHSASCCHISRTLWPSILQPCIPDPAAVHPRSPRSCGHVSTAQHPAATCPGSHGCASQILQLCILQLRIPHPTVPHPASIHPTITSSQWEPQDLHSPPPTLDVGQWGGKGV